MRKIAFMNQKGGVGKTTTTVNLAAALARIGQRVCVLDMDPQAHSTTCFGIEPVPGQQSMYEVLVRNKPLAEARVEFEPRLTLVPSHIDLAAAEMELAGVVGREMLLRDRLRDDQTEFDFILMDCPPSLGVLTLNALTAAEEVIVPLQPHFLALHGLSKLFETVELVAQRINPKLTISGVVLCMYESGTRLSAEILSDLEAFLAKSRQTTRKTPWSDAVVYRTRVRRNIKVAESTSFGRPVLDYDASCNGSVDYKSLAREVLAQSATLRSRPEPLAASA